MFVVLPKSPISAHLLSVFGFSCIPVLLPTTSWSWIIRLSTSLAVVGESSQFVSNSTSMTLQRTSQSTSFINSNSTSRASGFKFWEAKLRSTLSLTDSLLADLHPIWNQLQRLFPLHHQQEVRDCHQRRALCKLLDSRGEGRYYSVESTGSCIQEPNTISFKAWSDSQSLRRPRCPTRPRQAMKCSSHGTLVNARRSNSSGLERSGLKSSRRFALLIYDCRQSKSSFGAGSAVTLRLRLFLIDAPPELELIANTVAFPETSIAKIHAEPIALLLAPTRLRNTYFLRRFLHNLHLFTRHRHKYRSSRP